MSDQPTQESLMEAHSLYYDGNPVEIAHRLDESKLRIEAEETRYMLLETVRKAETKRANKAEHLAEIQRTTLAAQKVHIEAYQAEITELREALRYCFDALVSWEASHGIQEGEHYPKFRALLAKGED